MFSADYLASQGQQAQPNGGCQQKIEVLGEKLLLSRC
jgi:hypothetical protein